MKPRTYRAGAVKSLHGDWQEDCRIALEAQGFIVLRCRDKYAIGDIIEWLYPDTNESTGVKCVVVAESSVEEMHRQQKLWGVDHRATSDGFFYRTVVE